MALVRNDSDDTPRSHWYGNQDSSRRVSSRGRVSGGGTRLAIRPVCDLDGPADPTWSDFKNQLAPLECDWHCDHRSVRNDRDQHEPSWAASNLDRSPFVSSRFGVPTFTGANGDCSLAHCLQSVGDRFVLASNRWRHASRECHRESRGNVCRRWEQIDSPSFQRERTIGLTREYSTSDRSPSSEAATEVRMSSTAKRSTASM